MGWYNKRPSLWVEPRNQWGKGAVSLMEIPTTGETLDNIVCFWQPEKAVKAGDELDFRYRLYWSAQPPVSTPLARVLATRTGMGASRRDGRRGTLPGQVGASFCHRLCRRRSESGRAAVLNR